ncbi:50S ribosomal protein L15 [Desulfosarcina widdelii]|uniref:Large ribosomal subunit protein uL15 n=1 Tax=Desulfosarcina widdelii TaxID=947919 RepID=A0A5K7Z2F4_9BACT|nr:50S ribosomal protein L15 [Desulfosarcina widdelii]BBO74875.1 50S ribosomal protein L15 [Desulfosarcina widdelii]
MRLNELAPEKGQRKNRKRVGRGVASGSGKTAGRGNKGQNCRSGGGVRPGYEGGQMPIHRRLPKRGFKNPFKKVFSIVNVQDLNRFEADSIIDEVAFIKSGLVKGDRDGIKILGKGDVQIPVTVRINKVSESARQKIEAAGGKIEVI